MDEDINFDLSDVVRLHFAKEIEVINKNTRQDKTMKNLPKKITSKYSTLIVIIKYFTNKVKTN